MKHKETRNKLQHEFLLQVAFFVCQLAIGNAADMALKIFDEHACHEPLSLLLCGLVSKEDSQTKKHEHKTN